MAGVDSRLGSPDTRGWIAPEDPDETRLRQHSANTVNNRQSSVNILAQNLNLEDYVYESKAEILYSGVSHKDTVMRRLAAEQVCRR